MRLTKRELIDQIEKLSIDPIWGCYTRAACELRWTEFTKHAISVVYTDIDDMHGLNSQYGHAEVDRRIAQVIANTRHDSESRYGDIVASRWLNGDELVFILRSGNGQEFCERIQADFQAVGINCTMAHTTKIMSTPCETISPLDEQVNQYKRVDLRGEIISLVK